MENSIYISYYSTIGSSLDVVVLPPTLDKVVSENNDWAMN